MIWDWCPSSLTEALEWKTEVFRSRTGEQRVALRATPRRSIGMDLLLSATEYEQVRSSLRGTLPGPWWIPDWLGFDTLVTAGQDQFHPLHSGAFDEYLLCFGGANPSELLLIEEVTTEGVVITTTPAANPHPYYSPALPGYILNDPTVAVQGGPNFRLSLTFSVFESIVPEAEGLTLYKGVPLLTDCPKLSDLSESLERQLILVDNEFNTPFIEVEFNTPRQHLVASWMVPFGAECWRLRTLFQSFQGKQKHFWTPAWNRGITLTQDIAGASMLVRDFGFTSAYGTGDIYIQKKSGGYEVRGVTASSVSGGVETLVLDSSLTLSRTEVDFVSLLLPVRLDADRVEFSGIPGYGARVSVPLIGVPLPGDPDV